MALAVGNIVFLGAAVLGPNGQFVIHQDQPMFGTIEAFSAGTPPTAVVVVWSDGSRVQYAVVGSGASSLLFQLGPVAGGVPAIGAVGQPKLSAGIPNPGSRLQGPIIQQYGLLDLTDTLIGEVVVIDTPIGFLAISPTDADILPAA